MMFYSAYNNTFITRKRIAFCKHSITLEAGDTISFDVESFKPNVPMEESLAIIKSGLEGIQVFQNKQLNWWM